MHFIVRMAILKYESWQEARVAFGHENQNEFVEEAASSIRPLCTSQLDRFHRGALSRYVYHTIYQRNPCFEIDASAWNENGPMHLMAAQSHTVAATLNRHVTTMTQPSRWLIECTRAPIHNAHSFFKQAASIAPSNSFSIRFRRCSAVNTCHGIAFDFTCRRRSQNENQIREGQNMKRNK